MIQNVLVSSNDIIVIAIILTTVLYSDVNECENNAMGAYCEQICINTFGSYHCACYDGYRATNDTNDQCIGNLCYHCTRILLVLCEMSFFRY